ncbi:hypothetical protein [Luteimonas sp. MC1572]|uniref:hypothetical protein n=1 Tax=Luteimonas sp. MC1572 TaxID=2799325 RepID=UPI0018F0D7DB|nr:hypothetical protein [Luteimonas sp. MC1572]MBJ6982167.1 hypothetical protein [Luteimonas sp. MC1572]QQO03451.1 hypothetical protein JGR64_01340 [Luteimonas sp. MC1572]
MKLCRAAKFSFIALGLYAVLCAPAILIAEHFGCPQWPFHLTQLIAVVGCISASAVFLFSTRGSPFHGIRLLAAVTLMVAALWAAFVVYVLMTVDFGWD